MPVNYQQIQSQVREFSQNIKARQAELNNKGQKAAALLKEYAHQGDLLADKVARAAALNGNLRCAIPAGEMLDAAFPLPPAPPHATLLAADGSQINPSRHSQVEYCEINIGVIQLALGSGNPPEMIIRSELLDVDRLYTPNGIISEGAVALLRDLNERKVLIEMVNQQPGPVITLTDGPLELFREPKETANFEKSLDEYLDVLTQLAHTGAATAGFVDKPRSDLVVRLLEMAALAEDRLGQAGKEHPFLGLDDKTLFRDILAAPGARSALFAIQSVSAQKFTGELALHFFFLNVGRPGHPWLVRVEIPAWVACNPDALRNLHAVLVAQSEIMGTAQPYPYLLHRAHEVAVVTLDDQEQLERMIDIEMRNQGVEMGEVSHKQSSKDQSSSSTKKRYGK
jgi:hypothetical protein